MNARNFTALILAAGLSSRMQDFKPLLHIGGETITDHVISTFLKNDIEVLLVTGWRRNELVAGIKHHDIRMVDNPDYATGMFSSIRAGISRLPPDGKGFFIMPVDVPLVRTATIKHLLDTAITNPGRIIYPTFNGKHGHPTFIPSFLIPEIMSWQKEGGLKALLDSHSKIHLETRVADEFVLLDVDEPRDFATLLERFRNYEVPTSAECDAILDIVGTASNIRRHCRKVSEVAVVIAEALVQAGHKIDTEAVRTAAVLHDVAREKPKHSTAGSLILREFGFNLLAKLVEMHTELPHDSTPSLEAKIVFLADKFVRHEKLVSIEERYSASTRNYATTPEIAESVRQRQEQALNVKTEIETLLGHSLDSIVFKLK
jgi:molybdenum cofactor cytidylyltransferase